MKDMSSSGFAQAHPLLYRFVLLGSITLCVYLVFRYLLVLFLPFILAYLLMRMLFPLIWFLRHRCRFPKWLAYSGTLTLFLGTVFGTVLILIWQFWKQAKLFLQNFPFYRQEFMELCVSQADRVCRCFDAWLGLKAGMSLVCLSGWCDEFLAGSGTHLSKYAGSLVSLCVSGTARFFTVLLVVIVSMIALCGDMQAVHRIYRKSVFYPAVHRVAVTLKRSGLAFVKSQGIILVIIWIICSVALTLIHNPYSILIGCGIAVFDTFPVLGSGMILVPWAVYTAFQQNYYAAVVLFIAFLLCVVVRDLLEAHMMGNHMGLLPFFMTAALYVGVCLFGVGGILLGPVGVILIRCIYEQFLEKNNEPPE